MSGRGVRSIRGMNDILPGDASAWQTLERVCRETFAAYGYQPIRLPLLERTELFTRAVGEVTDIVEKEMYTFEDRGGDSVSLRPEGTAGCVRAGIEHGLLHNQVQRFWYAGPMFRYERPQKGRYRQFHQFGVEAYGLTGPDVDAEQIALCARLWRRLGLTGLRLEINSLGTVEERQDYRRELMAYFSARVDQLDEDSRRRLDRNPMRILDSKNPDMRPVIAAAPAFEDSLGPESREHFDGLRARLDAMGIDYTVNPRLVRGLDYYTRTVFEWLTDQLGAQDAVCSGGRYDGLVDQLGGSPTPAVGFALGVERLVALIQDQGTAPDEVAPHAYLVHQGGDAERQAMLLAETLRDALPHLRLHTHSGGGSFKSQFKRADRSGAALALVMGEEEAAQGVVQIKHLRADQAAEQVGRDQLADRLGRYLAGPGGNDEYKEQQ